MRCVLNYIRRQWIARPLAVFSVCFLLGVLHGENHRLPLGISCLLPVLIYLLHAFLKKRFGKRWFILPMLAAFLLGNARMIGEYRMNPAVPDLFSVNYSGKIISEPYHNEATERIVCVLHVDELCGVPADYDVKLYLRSEILELTGIEYGQRLDCFGHIWPQDSATNPYEYYGMKALRKDGLHGMAAAKLEDVTISPSEPSLGRLRVRIRQAIAQRIEKLFPENAALVCAFVLGDRHGLDQETSDAFRDTGVTHLISISGLHISTLAMAVSKLLELKFSRKTSAFGTLAAVLLYGFLIGFPASLVRATVMFGIYSLVPVVGRPSDSITRLATAMVGMLVFNPFNIFDGGFVLSFGASAGILLLTEPLEHLFHIEDLRSMKPHPKLHKRLLQKLIRYFPLLLCTTLAAQLATLPAVIGYFGSQPLISIPVNLMAIPLAMTAYPIALIALAVSCVLPPLGQLIAAASDGCFSLLTWLVRAFASISFGVLRSPSYPAWLIATHCIVVLLASGLNRIKMKRRRYFPLALVFLVGISMLNSWLGTLGFTAIFLDADQADAALIKTEGRVYAFDTGDLYSPIADYASATCLGMDAVFLSHPDYDHASGLIDLVEKLPPKVIYVPEGWFDMEFSDSVSAAMKAAEDAGIPIEELSSGDELTLSRNTFARIHASANPKSSSNDLSMLVEVVYRNRSLFYTGDLSAKNEPAILPDIDILKVPHHGSAKATSERFLCATSPEIAIISVGDNNYGHPSDETLCRLKDSGAKIYRTDQCGAIEIRIDGDGEISVKTYLPMEDSHDLE